MTGRIFVAISFVLAVSISCSKGEKPAAGDTSAAAAAAAPSGKGGKVIIVQLISDAKGNYFEPSELEAHRGDTIRYTLKVGVHNVHFLPDSNTIKSGLPPASELLQLPGQTYDLPVNFQEGKYYFQCDPHAALGMRGHLKVED